MNERYITEEMLSEFQEFLLNDEKSSATIAKYMHDVRKFCTFAVVNLLTAALYGDR